MKSNAAMKLCNLLPDLCKVVSRCCPKKKEFKMCRAAGMC